MGDALKNDGILLTSSFSLNLFILCAFIISHTFLCLRYRLYALWTRR